MSQSAHSFPTEDSHTELHIHLPYSIQHQYCFSIPYYTYCCVCVPLSLLDMPFLCVTRFATKGLGGHRIRILFLCLQPSGGVCGNTTVAVASGEAKLNSYSLAYRNNQGTVPVESSQGPEASRIDYSQPGTTTSSQANLCRDSQSCCHSGHRHRQRLQNIWSRRWRLLLI